MEEIKIEVEYSSFCNKYINTLSIRKQSSINNIGYSSVLYKKLYLSNLKEEVA